MDTTLDFLNTLWHKAPADHYFLMWTMPDKRSRWFRASSEGMYSAAETVVRIRERNDIYIGASLSSRSYGSRQRVAAADTSGITGLWVDIDYNVGKAHKKPNLPPDQKSAIELLNRAPAKPTIIVHSGHGLQAWWLFDEPLIFADREEQVAAQELVKAWNFTIRDIARKDGWDVDATWDLARVMRLPGGLNHKSNPAPEVRILELNDDNGRHSVDELRKHCKAPKTVKPKMLEESNTRDYGFLLKSNANPPFEKWEALRSADTGVEQAWARKRTRMADQSASAYDMALANFAAIAGWEDQEIVDLLIASRRAHGDDLKLNRPDYYGRTIRKARDATSREQAPAIAEELIEELEYAQSEDDRSEVRNKLCDWLSEVFKVGITRVERFESDPPTYRLLTENGWAHLGTTNELFQQQRLRAAIVEVVKQMPPRMKPKDFDQVVTVIVQASQSVDMGPETTAVGSVAVWLEDYLEQNEPMGEQDWDDSTIIARAPFVKDAHTHVFLQTVRQFIEQYEGEKVTVRELADRLKKYGAEPVKVNVSVSGSPTSRSVWRLPPST